MSCVIGAGGGGGGRDSEGDGAGEVQGGAGVGDRGGGYRGREDEGGGGAEGGIVLLAEIYKLMMKPGQLFAGSSSPASSVDKRVVL